MVQRIPILILCLAKSYMPVLQNKLLVYIYHKKIFSEIEDIQREKNIKKSKSLR